ncbi:MAG: type II toxin-antitoxin system RelE/ParE family toxin [Burkholderiaceae bacterium]
MRLTETAENDLAQIWVYIATEASENTATQFLARIERTISRLRQTPMIGASREMLGPQLRVVFHPPYAIYYVPDQTEVVIVRVLHGARDLSAISDQGGLVP